MIDAERAVLTMVGVPAAGLLAALHYRCFDDAWPEHSVAEVLAMPGAFAALAELDHDGAAVPAGFAIARQAADEVELLSLGVLAPYRGLRLGSRLIAAVVERARAGGARFVFLEVAEDNAPARALYGREGFVRVGRRPGYYRRYPGPSVAALTLRLRLAPAIDAWPML